MAQTNSTGSFHSCATNGDATAASAADPDLNALKNRDIAPPNYTTKTVATIVADKPFNASTNPGKKRRDKWTQTQRNKVNSKKRAISAEVVATRKVQGQYIAHLWKFPKTARGKFQKIARTKSREEAIAAMKKALTK